MVNSEVARMSPWVCRRGEMTTARIGGQMETGECQAATIVFGFLSWRSAVTRTRTFGARRR
jgi:hypothetical protein